ncbi:MAG: hypothetical protein NTV93_07780 [Verrucomicrobia bacterium]|nr:hypothetical protein [Verrucomicrobiota bacterium]
MTFTIVDSASGKKVENATVSIDGSKIVSGDHGTAVIRNVAFGGHNYLVAAENYLPANASFNVSGATLLTVKLSRAPQKATLTFVILDSQTGRKIENATLSFDGKSSVPSDHGTVVLRDITQGNHTYAVSAANYLPVSAPVKVQESTTLTIKLTPIKKATLTFVIVDSRTGRKIEDAMLSFDGKSIEASDSGTVVLRDVTLGSHAYVASAKSRLASSATLNVTGSTTITIKLSRDSSSRSRDL